MIERHLEATTATRSLGTRIRPLPAFFIWLVLSVSTGVTLTSIYHESMGGESIVFVGVGFASGSVAGTVFGWLANRQLFRKLGSLIRGFICGLASSVAFLLVDSLLQMRAGAGVFFDPPVDLALVGGGVVIGMLLTSLPPLREAD